jgi:lysophospholipid acyltransferase (LPLAT)-like uncharacterized protein
MSDPVLTLSEWWGRQIARYGLWAVDSSQMVIENKPDGTRLIAVNWHSYNMVALATIHLKFAWNTYAFVPPGMVGGTMSGWLVGSGLNIVPLPEDGTGNPIAALKTMSRALDNGGTPIIAVDGPHGPAWKVRPGALWLARLSGAPVIPVGLAASPALRFPRWDRHLIPLPGGKIAIIFGEPITIGRKEEITDEHLTRLGADLDACKRRAEERVASMQ